MPRGEFLKAELLNQAFAVCPTKMQAYMDVLDTEVPKAQSGIEIANNNVKYSTVNDIAVISIDGAMYKKSMNGACGESVVSYPDINKAIDKAEADVNIHTILFRVDTPGGSVAGAEETRYKIKSSSKKTVTFYENLGASGGMWIFTASDELYAAPTTWLGSIGVVVAYEEDDGESKKVELVSKNAPNKRCKTNGDCRDKMQTMIDEIENDFFAVLKENTGHEKEFLVETFNNGGIIKAEIAKDKGFIKDISHFSVLLGNLKSTTGVQMSKPDVEEKVDAVANAKTIGGFVYSEENFEMLVESREKSQETIKTLNEKVAANSDASEKFENFRASLGTRIAMAMSYNITDVTVIENIACADTDADAIKLAIAKKEESTVIVSASEGKTEEAKKVNEKEAAEALAKQYSL